MSVTGIWFRKDLRLMDNTALQAAITSQQAETDQLIGIFHLNPMQFKADSLNHGYFFSAVLHFSQIAAEAGLPIHFLFGEIEAEFTYLKQQIPDLKQIYYNQDQRGFGNLRDTQMEQFFSKNGIQAHSFQDSHLHGVTENHKQDGTAFKVFTPYYRSWLQLAKPTFQKTNIAHMEAHAIDRRTLFSRGQAKLMELMAEIDGMTEIKASGLAKAGAAIARKQLSQFIATELSDYQTNRDIPALAGTSRLSRFLRTGELSIREVYWRVQTEGQAGLGKETFIKELCWRDFYNMIYFENPQQQTLEIQEKYRGLAWNQNTAFLVAWQKGETGYPIVDAAMKQLNQTGWMHNRLRMIVASFLVKDLLVDWRAGEAYFAKQLIDYDSASNIGGWQWAASTGTDAVPYFRIFNPTTQSTRFDAEGLFIRRYLPVLAQVPAEFIHEPSKMPLELQQELNLVIGRDYPAPIVEHKKMRQLALELYKGH